MHRWIVVTGVIPDKGERFVLSKIQPDGSARWVPFDDRIYGDKFRSFGSRRRAEKVAKVLAIGDMVHLSVRQV